MTVWTDEQIGAAYERAVGALYESHGFTVTYRGIERGKQDGGIDLECVKGTRKVLVQCKCWGRNTEISHVEIRKFAAACDRHTRKHADALQEILPGFPRVTFGWAFISDAHFSWRASEDARRLCVSLRGGLVLDWLGICSRPDHDGDRVAEVQFSRRGRAPSRPELSDVSVFDRETQTPQLIQGEERTAKVPWFARIFSWARKNRPR